MSQQDTAPAREFRAVEALTNGDHVLYEFGEMTAWRVGQIAPYSDEDQKPMVALMLTPVAGGEPVLARERRGVTLALATEREVAQSLAQLRRETVASALVELARRIRSYELPVPTWRLHVSGVVDSREDVEYWASMFDGKVEMSGRIPVTDDCTLGGADGPIVDVKMQGPAEPEAEPSDDEIADEIDAAFAEQPAAEQEHRLAGGSAGGYGACSAVCLCGLTYAGFDTHREAADLIERHVAEEAAKTKAAGVQPAGE